MQTESIESRIERLLMGSWLSNCFHNSSVLMNFDPPYCPPFSLLHTFSSFGPPPTQIETDAQMNVQTKLLTFYSQYRFKRPPEKTKKCSDLFGNFWLLAVIAQIFGHHPLQQALVQILITSSCRPCWLYQQLIFFSWLLSSKDVVRLSKFLSGS